MKKAAFLFIGYLFFTNNAYARLGLKNFKIDASVSFFWQSYAFNNQGPLLGQVRMPFIGSEFSKLRIGYLINSEWAVEVGISQNSSYQYHKDIYDPSALSNLSLITDNLNFHVNGRYYLVSARNSKHFKISTSLGLMFRSVNNHNGSASASYWYYLNNQHTDSLLFNYPDSYAYNGFFVMLEPEVSLEYLITRHISIGYTAGALISFKKVLQQDVDYTYNGHTYHGDIYSTGSGLYQQLKLCIYFGKQYNSKNKPEEDL